MEGFFNDTHILCSKYLINEISVTVSDEQFKNIDRLISQKYNMYVPAVAGIEVEPNPNLMSLMRGGITYHFINNGR